MIFGLDTETDNNGKDEAWIVQWAIHNGKKAWHGTDLASLRDCLLKVGGRGKHYFYVHNLKYDLAFIKYVIWNIKETQNGEINAIIRKGAPVSITLIFGNRKLIFRDSMKKWQGNLRSMGKTIGLEKLDPPGDEDFSAGWSEKIDYDDPETWKYVERDAEIVAVAMQQMHARGANKATSSGDAWKGMHEIINGPKWIKGQDKWTRLFPPLCYDLDKNLRPAYFGGINISRNLGLNKGPITHEDRVSMYPGIMYGTDGEELPFGMPIYIGSVLPPDDVLYITRQRMKLSLKEGHIAWFSFKDGYDYAIEDYENGTVIEHTWEWHELTLCSVDLANLAEDYDIKIDPTFETETWIFKSEVGILRDYIDKWIAVKKNAPKGSADRLHAKIMLNASYGRFALIQDSELVSLVYDEGEQDLKWTSEITVSENDAYLPLAIFTTAWARRRLMDRVRQVTAARGEDAVIHCDTDSVIYKGLPIGGTGKDLGCWDLEHENVKMVYEGGFKRYVEILNDDYLRYPDDPSIDPMRSFSMAAAGVPQHTFRDGVPSGMWVELLDDPYRITTGTELGNEHYKIRSEWLRKLYERSGRDPDDVNTMKLLPRTVRGGIILTPTTHRMTDNLKIRFNRAL